MPPEVRPHKRADRDDREPARPDVLERARDEPGTEPLTLEEGIDVGMEQHDRARLRLVGDEADDALFKAELVAPH